MSGLFVLAALILEAALGWPQALFRRIGHPVGMFGHVITGCAHRWNASHYSFFSRRTGGVATTVILIAIAGGIGVALQLMFYTLLDEWAWIGMAIAAWPAMAMRSLYDHSTPILHHLVLGDLVGAREAVSRIVGRDTQDMSENAVSRAAIESLAESFCDGVVAPLFWLMLAGLPGIWIYKAINTADSMVGHKDEKWGAFGWAAARLDDLLNWIPARLSAILIAIAAGKGWRVMWRDHTQHASPNSGWPEATMAGALDIRLAGPATYDGEVYAKPWIGDGTEDATASHLKKALRIYLRACGLLFVVAGGYAWLV